MSISSSSSSDGDDDDDHMMMLLILKKYTKAFVDRTLCRTSMLSGKEYIREIICGNPIQCYKSFRIPSGSMKIPIPSGVEIVVGRQKKSSDSGYEAEKVEDQEQISSESGYKYEEDED
uniref:Protein ALP1-like n=1 Tax=Tanacetum cinerariifolium TaxID=118510 RepID=A0A699KEU4_TANCI|nr:protein ALP1-like [Tanacetum cinerariifolium]